MTRRRPLLHRPLLRRLGKVVAWGLGLALLAAVFLAYLRPGVIFGLSDIALCLPGLQ